MATTDALAVVGTFLGCATRLAGLEHPRTPVYDETHVGTHQSHTRSGVIGVCVCVCAWRWRRRCLMLLVCGRRCRRLGCAGGSCVRAVVSLPTTSAALHTAARAAPLAAPEPSSESDFIIYESHSRNTMLSHTHATLTNASRLAASSIGTTRAATTSTCTLPSPNSPRSASHHSSVQPDDKRVLTTPRSHTRRAVTLP